MKRRLDRLRDLYKASLEATPQLDADDPNERIFDLVTGYATLIELGGSVEFLARHAHWAAVPPLVRTMLETYVDLLNLHADPAYMDYLAARDHEEGRTLLRGFRNPQGPLGRWLAAQHDMQEFVALLDAGLADATPDVKPLSVRDRFQRAGLVDAYEIIYRPLSSAAHSNRSALRHRHAEPRGGHLGVTLYMEPPELERKVLIGLSSELLGEAASLVYDACRQEVPAEISQSLDASTRNEGA